MFIRIRILKEKLWSFFTLWNHLKVHFCPHTSGGCFQKKYKCQPQNKGILSHHQFLYLSSTNVTSHVLQNKTRHKTKNEDTSFNVFVQNCLIREDICKQVIRLLFFYLMMWIKWNNGGTMNLLRIVGSMRVIVHHKWCLWQCKYASRVENLSYKYK